MPLKTASSGENPVSTGTRNIAPNIATCAQPDTDRPQPTQPLIGRDDTLIHLRPRRTHPAFVIAMCCSHSPITRVERRRSPVL